MSKEKFQLPPQMLQQLIRGPQPANKPPDVVEVICSNGNRCCFNMDAVERVDENGEACLVKLKGEGQLLAIDMSYDDFLLAAKVQPRQLYAPQADSSN